MADNLKGYSSEEVLNKVLNISNDAVQVDIIDATGITFTVDSEFPDAAAITDNFTNPTTTSVMSMLMGYDGTTWDRVKIGDGTAAASLRTTIATDDSHFGTVGTAADVDGVIHGQLRYIGTALDTIETTLTVLEDWDESDRAKVNLIAGQAGITAAAGAVAANTPRVTLGSDDPAVAKLGEIETTNNANQVLLGTIDSDTDATKSALNKMLYGTGLVITALDGGGGDQTLGATYESLYVGVGGNVKVTLATSASDFTFVNVASGQMLPIQITHVKQSGTTATNMIAMKA